MARHYTVTKMLQLEFTVEADSAKQAEALCIAANDQGPDFTCVDCQYVVTRSDTGEEIDVDNEELEDG